MSWAPPNYLIISKLYNNPNNPLANLLSHLNPYYIICTRTLFIYREIEGIRKDNRAKMHGLAIVLMADYSPVVSKRGSSPTDYHSKVTLWATA